MSPDDREKLSKLFFPHVLARVDEIKASRTRFSHYTSAYAALQIIENEEVWLRNAVLMNDYSEIQHGQSCINSAWNDPELGGVDGGKLHAILERIRPGLTRELAAAFDSNEHHRRVQSFLLSISEHGDAVLDEDRYGRLSMWRAYGGNTNVAFVFKTDPLMTESTALNAFTSPVFYSSPELFKSEFGALISGLESEIDFLCAAGAQEVLHTMNRAFHFAALSTKHPGFAEEREWRIIHSPTLMPSRQLTSNIETINGVPQRVYKLRLANIPDEGLVGATLGEALDKIIIGPTVSPWPIYEAIASKLESKGVSDAWNRVTISDIPLRR